MKRILTAAFVALFWILTTPTPAFSQSPLYPNIPAKTVIGRLGVAAGPSQAIPFSLLGPQLITNYLQVSAPLSIAGLVLQITGPANTVPCNNTVSTGLLLSCTVAPPLTIDGLVLQITGPTKTVPCNITTSTAVLTSCTVAQLKALQSLNISVTDPAYGAKGDCTTDDTAAFQAAWNAATGPSGAGRIHVPATSSCYLVTKINGTNSANVIVDGDGDQSLIKINGEDANGNWWDLSGSTDIHFRDLKFIDNGSPVAIAFMWACTGTSCGTSGVLSGLSFDHVNINAKTGRAVLFGYGFGCSANCSSNVSGAGLDITNSAWKNTYNQSVTAEETRNAVLSLSAYNAGSFRSVYVTLTTSTAIAARTHVYNSDFIEQSTTSTTLSNNAAVLLDGTNQATFIGGSFQCQCTADFIGWTSVEGLTIIQSAFQDPVPGSGCTVPYWMEFGGGINAAINLQSPFWSCPGSGGAFIALDQGTGAATGGINYLTVASNDPGLNTNNVPFIGKTAAGCGSFTVTNNWIYNSNIQFLNGANNITTCGSIDSSTILQLPGTITLASGAKDASLHVPRKTVTVQTFASGTGTVTIAANTTWIEILLQGPGGGGAGSGTTTTGGAGGTGTGTCWNTTGAACTTPVYAAGAGAGAAGASSTAGGAGGAVTGSATCATPMPGGTGGTAPATNAISGGGGIGGGSQLGGAGAGGTAGGGAGGAGGTNTGSGGGGAGGVGTVNPGGGGGAGASCYAIINSPALTYTYAVGPAGGAGTAGTSGAGGGAGAAGYIRVTEH